MGNKRQQLLEQMNEWCQKDICVALSGGVDSSLLLKLATDAANKNGKKVYAITFDTVLHPRQDVKVAAAIAQEMGAIHKIIEVNELNHPKIKNNDKDRCYYCKTMLFENIIDFAKERQIATIIEGTNHDDLSQYRPGIRAIRELGILSPLAQYGFTKVEVRQWAKDEGVSVSKRPSAPCLATRLPYDTLVDVALLKRIEQGENLLRGLGFLNVRLRVHQEVVRLEVDEVMLKEVLRQKEVIITNLKELGFKYITMDLLGFYSGSMDI